MSIEAYNAVVAFIEAEGERLGLDAHEAAVLSLYAVMANRQTGRCWPTRETIAARTRLSLSSVARARRGLCKRELLVRVGGGYRDQAAVFELGKGVTPDNLSGGTSSPGAPSGGIGKGVRESRKGVRESKKGVTRDTPTEVNLSERRSRARAPSADAPGVGAPKSKSNPGPDIHLTVRSAGTPDCNEVVVTCVRPDDMTRERRERLAFELQQHKQLVWFPCRIGRREVGVRYMPDEMAGIDPNAIKALIRAIWTELESGGV